jgi:hypothetical protein
MSYFFKCWCITFCHVRKKNLPYYSCTPYNGKKKKMPPSRIKYMYWKNWPENQIINFIWPNLICCLILVHYLKLYLEPGYNKTNRDQSHKSCMKYKSRRLGEHGLLKK